MNASLPLAQTLVSVAPRISLDAMLTQSTRFATQERQAAVQTAVLEERKRMSREMHDTVAQGFTAILLQLEAAEDMLSDKPEEAQVCLARARQLARNGLAEVSRSIQALRPQLLEQADLPTALSWLCQHLSIPGRSQIACQLHGTPQVLPPEIADTLFRVAQEALTNACKHAHASQIQLRLSFETHQIQLRIQDNGQGWDCHRSLFRTGGGGGIGAGIGAGIGMMSMQERATKIGGWLRRTNLDTCESGHDSNSESNGEPNGKSQQGTVVILTVPIPYPNLSHQQSIV